MNMEMRVGKTRLDAMRELARRTGVEDIKALVAMLIQTERFGTSIAAISPRSFRRVAHKAASARRRDEREDDGEDGAGAGIFYFPGFDGGDSGPRRDHFDEAVDVSQQVIVAARSYAVGETA